MNYLIIIQKCIFCGEHHAFEAIFEKHPVFASSGNLSKEKREEEVVGVCPVENEYFSIIIQFTDEDGFELENISLGKEISLSEEFWVELYQKLQTSRASDNQTEMDDSLQSSQFLEGKRVNGYSILSLVE